MNRNLCALWTSSLYPAWDCQVSLRYGLPTFRLTRNPSSFSSIQECIHLAFPSNAIPPISYLPSAISFATFLPPSHPASYAPPYRTQDPLVRSPALEPGHASGCCWYQPRSPYSCSTSPLLHVLARDWRIIASAPRPVSCICSFSYRVLHGTLS
jgi:hypothetical protein